MTLAYVGEVKGDVRCVLERRAISLGRGRFLCVLDRIEALRPGLAVLAPFAPPPQLLGFAEGSQRLVRDVAETVMHGPYHSHVTLARDADHVRPVSLSVPVIWPVREYVLCRSKSTGNGSYDILERWPLYEDL